MKEITYGEIILPSVIHVAVGRECCLWWSTAAVYEEGDRSVYFETKCDIGLNTKRAFVLKPKEKDIGDHTLTLRCRDLRTREILGEQTVTVSVCPCGGGSDNRNILMIGDSRTWHTVDGEQGNTYTQCGNKTTTTELKSLLDASDNGRFTFLGTFVSPADESVRNLASSGWEYTTAISELKKAGGVRAYVEDTCHASGTLDYVTIMYGINDLADWHQNHLDQYERSVAKIDAITDAAKELVTMILADYPDCRILLILEASTSGDQDGFGYWGASDADCQVEWEYAVKALRKNIIKEFDCGRFSPNVTLSCAGLWCDRIYGYPYLNVPQSDRTPEATVMRLMNCVHPHDNGYRQIADGCYSSLKYIDGNRHEE